MITRPTRSTLFPYTTLFRSVVVKPFKPPEAFMKLQYARKLTVMAVSFWLLPSFALYADESEQQMGVAREMVQVLEAYAEIGRAHVELQSRPHLVCRLLLEKK